jgi:membrane protein YdbS with pleckstrin-like domain
MIVAALCERRFLFKTASMTHRPTWWSGSGVFLICIILAGIVTNMVIQTPNTVGGGTGMMFIIIVLAVIFKATFQFVMSRWQKRRDEKLKRVEKDVF